MSGRFEPGQRFTLSIDLGSAGMASPVAIADALRQVAGRVAAGTHAGKIIDVNGNSCGRFDVEQVLMAAETIPVLGGGRIIAIDVFCRHCSSPAGEPCTTATGICSPHDERYIEADYQNATNETRTS